MKMKEAKNFLLSPSQTSFLKYLTLAYYSSNYELLAAPNNDSAATACISHSLVSQPFWQCKLWINQCTQNTSHWF